MDEAHRLSRRKNLTSYKSFDNVNRSLGLSVEAGTQLDWIEKSAKHIVLLYDRGQRVRPADIPEERFLSIRRKSYHLKSQMRVLGGSRYIKYIEGILNGSLQEQHEFDQYDFRLFEDVDAMVNEIKCLNVKHELCRNVAGFAWDWISREDKNLPDIKIGEYNYHWNQTNVDWVNSENDINEIGCIHGIHGYDLNYTGVIIGPEIVYRNQQLQIVLDQYKDKKGKAGVTDLAVLKLYILNIYRVLLTRGIKGTFVYACDSELREYLKRFITTVIPFQRYQTDDHSFDKVAEIGLKY